MGSLLTIPLRAAQALASPALKVTGRAHALAGKAAEALIGADGDRGTAASTKPVRWTGPSKPPEAAKPAVAKPEAAEPEAAAAEPATTEPEPARVPTVAEAAVTQPTAAEPEPAREREPAAEPSPSPAAPPEHVSEEPVLVAETADPGAEDGAGAEISVAEPWEGYRRMKAADIIDRLTAATPEEAAVARLYESMNRRRKTVLEAADQSLSSGSTGSPARH